MDDLAALLMELDIVVGPFSSVIRLADTVGTSCLGMNLGTDWTCLGTDGQPWTPNMTVVYKGPYPNWGPALAEVAALVGEVSKD